MPSNRRHVDQLRDSLTAFRGRRLDDAASAKTPRKTSKRAAKPAAGSAGSFGQDVVVRLAALATLGQVVTHNESVTGKHEADALPLPVLNAALAVLTEAGTLAEIMALSKAAKNSAKYGVTLKRTGSGGGLMLDKAVAIDVLLAHVLNHRTAMRRAFKDAVPSSVRWVEQYLALWDMDSLSAEAVQALARALRTMRSAATDPDVRRLVDAVSRQSIHAEDGTALPPTDSDPALGPDGDGPGGNDNAVSTLHAALVASGVAQGAAMKSAQQFYQAVLNKDTGGVLARMAQTAPFFQHFRRAFSSMVVHQPVADAATPDAVADAVARWASETPADPVSPIVQAARPLPAADVPAADSPAPATAPAVAQPLSPPPPAFTVTRDGVPVQTPAQDAPPAGDFADVMAKYKVDRDKAVVIETAAPFVMVPAAAGSGKTRVVTTKVRDLLQSKGVSPSEVTLICFNRHAADELMNRFSEMLGQDVARDLNPMTTHGFSSRTLRSTGSFYREGLEADCKPDGPTNYGGAWLPAQSELIARAFVQTCERLDVRPTRDYDINMTVAKSFAARPKNEGMSLTEYLESFYPQADDPRVGFLALYTLLYEEQKGFFDRERARYGDRFQKVLDTFMVSPPDEEKAGNWVRFMDESLSGGRVRIRFDFDDWIHEMYESVTPKSYDKPDRVAEKAARLAALQRSNRYLFVDEAQDLSPVQVALYRAIGDGAKQYVKVGDDAQSIYGFRGANPEDFVRESREPGTQTLTLGTNYRSRREIVDAADRLINHNKVQIPKATRSARGDGGVVRAVKSATFEDLVTNVVTDIRASLVGPGGVAAYLDEQKRPRFAVLGRTRSDLDEFEDELAINGIEYVRRGGRPFWLKDDVGSVIALMALAFHRAGLMKVPAREQLAYLGRAMYYPRRNGSASGGDPIYHEPMRSSPDPLSALGGIRSARDAVYTRKDGRRLEAGEEFAALSRDIDKIAAKAPDLNGMFEAMLEGESRGFNKMTLKDALVTATAMNQETADEMSAEDAGGTDAPSSTKAGVSVFGKLMRYAAINNLADPQRMIEGMMAATERAAAMHSQQSSKFNRYAKNKGEGGTPAAVVLSTIHMTKGLEFEHVYVAANQSNFPSPVFPNDDLLANPARLAQYGTLEALKTEEERRLMYVAMTRATDHLTICSSNQTPGGKDTMPSQFIAEAGVAEVEITESAYDPGRPMTDYAKKLLEDYRAQREARQPTE